MFYKVIYNGKIIDVLDHLVYLRYQERYNRMILCDEREAQAILSSDEKYIWHVNEWDCIPVPGYDTVRIENIDAYEYNQLKILKCKTLEEVIDEYTLLLLNGGVL